MEGRGDREETDKEGGGRGGARVIKKGGGGKGRGEMEKVKELV